MFNALSSKEKCSHLSPFVYPSLGNGIRRTIVVVVSGTSFIKVNIKMTTSVIHLVTCLLSAQTKFYGGSVAFTDMVRQRGLTFGQA